MLKLGRNNIQHIFSYSRFTWVSGYTTSAINSQISNFAVDYLVNSLGFSKQQAIATSSKVRSFQSPDKPNSVVNLLKTTGFTQTQIQKVIFCVPKILFYDVDKTLKPKLEAFREFGLSESDLALVVSANPVILVRDLNTRILLTLEVLRSAFEDKSIVVEALKKCSWLLSPSVLRYLPSNIELLKSHGLSVDQIKVLLLRKSSYFVLDPKWLQSLLCRVEEKLGIPRSSPMFVYGVCALGSMSEECLESKFNVFRSFGWRELDILTMARQNPFTLAYSESKLRSCLKFFMKDIGLQPSKIALNVCLLIVSLEKRVIPRLEVMKVLEEKRLIKFNPIHRIAYWVKLSESRFFSKFVEPFEDEVLDLYTDCMRGAALNTAK